MEYVNLGSSGVKVSRLCLGTMTYGSRKWREWVLEEPESRPFIRQAIEAGIIGGLRERRDVFDRRGRTDLRDVNADLHVCRASWRVLRICATLGISKTQER